MGRPKALVHEVDTIQEGTNIPLQSPKTETRRNKVLTDEQRQRLNMALSDMSGASQLQVINGNPKYYYYLAAKDLNHPQSVAACARLGYEVVNRENNDGEVLPFGDVAETDSGALQTHELVLMRIPKEYHQVRLARMKEIGEERINSDEAALEETVRRQEMDGEGRARSRNRRTFIFGS